VAVFVFFFFAVFTNPFLETFLRLGFRTFFYLRIMSGRGGFRSAPLRKPSSSSLSVAPTKNSKKEHVESDTMEQNAISTDGLKKRRVNSRANARFLIRSAQKNQKLAGRAVPCQRFLSKLFRIHNSGNDIKISSASRKLIRSAIESRAVRMIRSAVMFASANARQTLRSKDWEDGVRCGAIH